MGHEKLSAEWQQVRSSPKHRKTQVRAISNGQYTRLLLMLFEYQIRYGCGKSTCTNHLCASNRRGKSVRPPREYSETSARAMAFHLTTLAEAESRLCSRVIQTFVDKDNRLEIETVLRLLSKRLKANLDSVDAPPKTDTKNFAQRLFTTDVVERFGGSPTPWKAPGKSESGTDTIVLRIMCGVRALLDAHDSVDRNLHSPFVQNAMAKLAKTLRRLLESHGDNLLARILRKELKALGPKLLVLEAMMQNVFVRHWDGAPSLSKTSIAADALLAMSALRELDQLNGHKQALHVNRAAENTIVDPSSFVIAFMSDRDYTSICLARFPHLLPQHHQITVFRGLCFHRMCKVVDTSRLYKKILQKCFVPLAVDRYWPPEVTSLQTGPLALAFSHFLTIQVRREFLLSDAMDQLWRRQKRELLRPLRVRIVSEAEVGVDQGGIAQEFFRLAWIEAFNPAYGLFSVDERTRFAWFDINSMEAVFKYEILGVIMALAIHNGFTLPVTFPEALYRRLLGLPVDAIEHIADGWPDLARGLTQLKEWSDGDVADVFLRTYEFSYERLGETVTYNMLQSHKPTSPQDTAEEPAPLVTNANRNAYIRSYIAHLTAHSVMPMYSAFARGFYTILPPSVLTATTPSTLRLLTEGLTSTIDTRALEKVTRYSNGYCAHHPYVKSFWAMVHGWTEERKAQLLEFVTASDRVPVNGVASIPFLIQKHGGATEERLPTSVTCFGRLLLPEYKNAETMRAKMEVALENARGFGLS